jgi:ribosomal protein L37AE/L43A
VRIRFACPGCERPAQLERPGPDNWRCSACAHEQTLHADPPAACTLCGNAELYRQKDFPHWLGLTILAVACLAFLVTNAIYHQWWAWAILIGSAIFDGVLYLLVRDVVVCYRCGAQFRGLPEDPAYQPHELGIAERYRQERIRREQLEAEQKK